MVTLSFVLFAGLVSIKCPALYQLAAGEIVSGQHSTCIVTAGHHHTRFHSVEIGNASEETVHTVTVSVTPCGNIASWRDIIHRGYSRSGLPVEQGQIFRTCQNISAVVAVILRTVTDYGALTVLGTVCCLDHNFSFAVAVQVIDHQLRIVGSGPDVHAKVNPPQLRAVKLNSINIDIAGITGLGIIL
ncbi:hypothetical protein PATY110618_27055 [Paenibacillus typhae]